MDINYLAVVVCAILAMVVGYLWYGKIFGKKWTEIIGATSTDLEERKKMQKAAGPLYVVQFVLVLFQIFVLAYYVEGWKDASGVESALWIWAAFIIPTVAASAMWNNDSKKIAWARFLIQGGYYLVLFIIFGLILGSWR